MTEINIGVFGSSSKATHPAYISAAHRLGELIASKGHTCVNGAGRYGVMGALNDGCCGKNGKIVGVIHSIFCVDASEHPTIKEIVVVDGIDLYNRKLALFNSSDCIIALPGGVGTFDELWDGISSRSLGMKDMTTKPICIVNIDGFYDGTIAQMHRAHKDGILYEDLEEYFHVENSVEGALEWCEHAVHSSRKIAADTHSRKVERMLARCNNVEAIALTNKTEVSSAEVTQVIQPAPVKKHHSTHKKSTSATGTVSGMLPVLVPMVVGVMLGYVLSRANK